MRKPSSPSPDDRRAGVPEAPEDAAALAARARTTVLLAAYNEERFVARAIRSVLAQTQPSFRLLVVDDGSRDGTRDIVRSFAGDARVRLVEQENQGQSAALQRGLGLVETPYLLQLDGDDELAPRAIALLEAAMDRLPPHAGVCYGNCIDLDHRTGRASVVRARPLRDKYDVLRAVGALVPRLYRTAALRAVGGWRSDDPFGGRYMEDKLMAFELANRFTFHWVDADLYVRRRHGNNQTVVAVREYAALKKWSVRRALAAWRSRYKPIFRMAKGWVRTEIEPRRRPPRAPRVSVIIPARDRRDELRLSLLSFYRQTADRGSFEVIVVDDASSDGTAEMIASLRPPFELRHVRLDQRGFCTGAKNAGLQVARGEIVIFSDSDHVAPPNLVDGHAALHAEGPERTVTGVAEWMGVFSRWLPAPGDVQHARLLELAREPEIAARLQRGEPLLHPIDVLTGAAHERMFTPAWASAWARVRLRYGDALEGCPVPWLFFIGRNQSIQRRTLERVGVFEGRMTRMGDWELALRLRAAGVGFAVAPELEGLQQAHPRDAQHEAHVVESFRIIADRHDHPDVLLLAAHLLGWLPVDQLALLAEARTKLARSPAPAARPALAALDAAGAMIRRAWEDPSERPGARRALEDARARALAEAHVG
jgi:glycosyltransferase involved in cell wall biosynthesis